MKNFKSVFTTAAMSTLLALGIQQLNYGETDRPANLAVANTTETAMAVDHVAISVPNYEETVQWYRDNLDATIEKEWTVAGLPDLKLAYLNVQGFRLEIIGSTQPQTGMPPVADFGEHLRTTGLAHLCFRVDDVDALMTRLEERGVPTFVEAASYPNVGVRVGFVKDNNGNVIEFVQSL